MLSRSYVGSRGSGSDVSDVGQARPLALGAWNPLLAAALHANALAHEGLGTLGSEWQTFVEHRLQQNCALIERLSQSRTSHQVVSAYRDFWQQVAESYGKELTTLTKLMTGMTSKIVMAAQATSQAHTPHAPGATA